MAGLVSARLRLLLLALGAGVLVVIVWQAGPAAVARRLAEIGPHWPLVLLPSVAVMLVGTAAWRYAFTPGASVDFLTVLRARIAGEAVNVLTPVAYVGGEPVKAYLVSSAVPLSEGLSAAIVGKTVMVLAQVAFVVLGIAATLGRFGGPGYLFAAGLGVVAAGAVFLWWLVRRQQRGLLRGLVNGAARLGIHPRWVAERAPGVTDVDARIARVYREARGRLSVSFSLYFLAWVLGTGETYLALLLMGLPVDLRTALALEALSGMAKGATFFIPASLGGQEGGHVLLFTGFGYPLASAVGYSVVRRVRELLWAALGLALIAFARHERRGPAAR